MPDVPQFVNTNIFPVSIQDDKGRTIQVQPFAMRGRVPDADCIKVGHFYRRYVGPRGPLFPFPESAVPSRTPVAPPGPVDKVNENQNAAGGGQPAGAAGNAPQTPQAKAAGTGVAAGGRPATGHAKSPSLDEVSFGWLRQSISESDRDDITNDDVVTMANYIITKRGKKKFPLPERLENFATDLNEIVARRNPHKVPVNT